MLFWFRPAKGLAQEAKKIPTKAVIFPQEEMHTEVASASS